MPRLLPSLVALALAVPLGSAARPADTPAQAIAGPAAVAHAETFTPTAEDPFPIRRVRATEAQLGDVLREAESGPLVRLTRGEFEARARAAGRTAAEARELPRVTESRWKASLVGGDLVGVAELEVAHASASPALLSLDPLRLALGPGSWAGGRAAVLGVSGGTAGVWVEKAGRDTLKFPWSLAGVTEPGERRFELRVPASPAASLEVELPAGQVPTTAATDVLVSGPFPSAADPGRAAWRFRFGGRSRLDFSVRPAGNPGVVASAVLRGTYDVTPGQLAAAFEYELRPAKGAVGAWEFAVDPGLRVTNVEVNNRAGWVVDPAPTPGAPRTLRVTLRQPGAGGKVLISATAAFPDSGRPAAAPLPAVRPLGACLDDETLTVRIAPELRPTNWDSGDYRLVDSELRPDGSRELTLTGTLLPAGANRPFRQTPALQPATSDAEFATLEQTAWRLDADRAAATVRVEVRVRRGPLFQLALKVPPGYAFARLASVPDQLVASSEVSGGAVAVEFARPLTAGQTATLTFELTGPRLALTEQQLAFPAFTPVRAAERVGVLGVLPAPAWVADVRPGVGTLPAGWFTLDPPLPPAGALIAFRYRADDPEGSVTLTPVRPEFAADVATRVDRVAGGAEATSTPRLRVARGGLPWVAIVETGRVGENRSWRAAGGGNTVASAVPVPLALLAGPGAAGDLLWLVRLARPAAGEAVVETTAAIPPDTSPPNLTVPGALSSLGGGADVSRPAPPPPAAEWAYSGLYHATAVQTPQDVLVVFGGTVTSAASAALPVELPEGVELRAASVGGRWVEPGGLDATAGVLRLPVATVPARFEVRYRLPAVAGGLAREIDSPVPGLPGAGREVRRWWSFGPEVLPGWPVRAWDREATGDLPDMLGPTPAAGPGGAVWRSPVGGVRVARTRLADAAGVATAAALFALAWAAGRRRHPACGLLAVAGLAAVGAAAMLGPPWWQRAAAVPLVVGLLAAAGMVVARGHRSRRPAAAAAVAALCVLSWSDGVAQPVAPATVVVLPADANGRETVAAPKALLDRLADAARPASPGAVVTAAEYAATADEATARVTAKFTAHAFEADAVASLPLAEARLEGLTVDGRPAFPASPRPGVYTVALPTRGRHEIEARFTVPVVGTGSEREFRFGVPESPAAKVVADLPGAAKQAQVIGRVGRQAATTGARVRLEADAGAVRAVQVRWRDEAGGSAALKVREGCVWDVSEGGAELTACYIVRVEQGTAPALRYDVPAELDVLGVAVRPLDAGSAAALRDWSLGEPRDGYRPLRLDFQAPAAGRVLAVLTLAPRVPLSRQPSLRFPRVEGAAGETDAVHGLRTRGVAVEDLGRGGVIDYPPDALTRDFAADLRLDPQTPVRVFRPTPGGVPVLRPTFRAAGDPAAFTLDTTWHLGLRRADADGTIRWAGKEPQAVVEFTLPAVKLAELRGPDVASWSQSGPRVQVWLARPAAEGEVAWAATVTPQATPFALPVPRPAGGRLAGSTLRLAAAAGFAVRAEPGPGWAADDLAEGVFRATNPAAPPVRAGVAPIPPALRDDELGWLAPRPKPPSPPAPQLLPTPVGAPQPAPPSNQPAGEPSPRWVLPVSVAAAWGLAALVLAVLLAQSPSATWPEQLGLVGVLFGAAVAGGWWVGVLAWAAARAAWLAEFVFRLRRA